MTKCYLCSRLIKKGVYLLRISAIQSYYRTNNTYSNNRKNNISGQVPAAQNNMGMIPVVSRPDLKAVNFTGVYSPLSIVKKFPLDDRLADLFNLSISGDMIVAAKDLKTAQKALRNNVKNIGHVIKRLFLVPEDGLDGVAAFARTPDGSLEVFNPNEANIYVNDFRGKHGFIKTGESAYVVNGDVVKLGDRHIKIKDHPDADISVSRHIFAKVIDKTHEVQKDVQNAVERANTKTLTSLTSAQKTKYKPITFADIGGQDSVIKDLKKGILYPIKYPEAYKNSIPNHGFILYGPPGTGKTLIAQALANESNASFIKLNGLEMESMWVGESEKNWRKLFDNARKNQPAIIFIDEFDAVAKKRGSIDVYGDKVVNQLLTLMSDVEKNGDDIYVVAATNNQKALDEAITRSGRFGKHIEVKAPDNVKAVSQILDIHTKNKTLAPDLNKAAISEKLLKKRATGADIAHIVNAANENAFERAGIYEKMENGTFANEDIEKLQITEDDFNKAIDAFANKNNQRKPVGFNK